MATRKPGPEVRIKVRADDGGHMEGTVTRTLAVPMIYYCMSPAERAEVRAALDECDKQLKGEPQNG